MRRTPSILSVVRGSLPRLTAALIGVLLGLGFVGCGAGEDEASIEERLSEKGSVEVMEEAGKAEYDPPEDGRLAEAQVERYIEVQERAARIREVAQKQMQEVEDQATEDGEEGDVWSQVRNMGAAMQGFGDMMTADLRAAQELGYNPAEYQWVRERVFEALAAKGLTQMQQGANDAQRQLLVSLRERRDEIEDESQRAMLDQQIEAMEEALGSSAPEELDAGMRENIELVERYEEEILAAHAEREEDA